MINRIFSASLALAVLLPGLLWGHHSPSAIFDMKTRVPLKGSITKVDWINPHIITYNASGRYTTCSEDASGC